MGHFGKTFAAHLCQEFGGVFHISGFVRFATFGHRGQERRIGFHQDAVLLYEFGGFLDLLRVFKRQNARKRDLKTQIQSLAGKVHVFGEAMYHAGLGLFFAEQAQGVGAGIAGVHNQRQAAGIARLDVGAKTVVLPS